MAHSGTAPRPLSLWIAVAGSAASALAVVGVGVVSMVTNLGVFSIGVGLMLISYGLLMAAGAWLGWRRHQLSRGLIVAPALLNLAIVISLMGSGDVAQTTGAAVAAVVFVVTVVAAVLPSTRMALEGSLGRATPRKPSH